MGKFWEKTKKGYGKVKAFQEKQAANAAVRRDKELKRLKQQAQIERQKTAIAKARNQRDKLRDQAKTAAKGSSASYWDKSSYFK